MIFYNRHDAGRKLSEKLLHFKDADDVIVLGLPRGGVPVAYEIARAIHAPLDIFIVRKLGVPTQPELAMGAMASGNVLVLNKPLIKYLRISDEEVEHVARKEALELERREMLYRKDCSAPDLHDKTVILVDDGLATGASMQAAVNALKKLQPNKIVIAVPVSSEESCLALGKEVDEIICLNTPYEFQSVGAWYVDFTQTTDQEVCKLLERAHQPEAA